MKELSEETKKEIEDLREQVRKGWPKIRPQIVLWPK